MTKTQVRKRTDPPPMARYASHPMSIEKATAGARIVRARRYMISEAEACRWLGQRVSLIADQGASVTTGRLQHVSSRSAFLLQEDQSAEPLGAVIRLIPLARIDRIVPAGSQESPR